MDTVVRLKQIIYWPNFMTKGEGARRRMKPFHDL